METSLDDAEVACSLDQDGFSDRKQRWHALADRALLDIAVTDTGLRLSFRPGRGIESELERLVGLEGECCAFADWSVQTDGDRVLLTVSGDSNEAVAAVHAMSAGLSARIA